MKTPDFEETLIQASMRLLQLALRAAEQANVRDRAALEGANRLYREHGLGLRLTISTAHDPGSLASVALEMVRPESGEAVVNLFAVDVETERAH